MQHESLYLQNRNQMLVMAVTIFASITAAVIVSTLIVMSLMRGEIAGALASNVQNSSPTSQTAGTCVAPAEEQQAAVPTTSTASVTTQTAGATAHPFMLSYLPTGSVHNSFNSSNTSSTNTTNNVTNTEVHNKTYIKDSFNDNSKHTNVNIKDSFNPVVIKDNFVNVDVNSHNNTAVNSGNTTTHNTTNTTNTVVNSTSNVHSNNVTNVASNNTTNSNNTVENHLLSDNTVVAVLP